MGYYLFDNPPAVQQYYPNRNTPWRGGVLIHTAENVMDSVGPDTGAENVAAYIARRTDYGSYHILADSDSVIRMLPPTATAFHCAASGYNSTTVGVSYACRTVDLNPDSEWFRRASDLIAQTLVDYWRMAGLNPRDARFVVASQTREGMGLSTHGEAQPVDRSDAWTRRPDRNRLEAVFADAIIRHSGDTPTPDPEDDEVAKTEIVRDPRTGTMWHVGDTTRYALRSQGEVDALLFLGKSKFWTVPAEDPAAVQGLVNYLRAHKDLGRPKGK